MAKISKKKFIKAVEGTGGVLTTIAINCSVTRATVYSFLEKNPDMKLVVEEESEKIIDLAENKLFVKINNNQDWAIRYLLSTKGKKRGYIERNELTGKDGEPLEGPRIFKPSKDYDGCINEEV